MKIFMLLTLFSLNTFASDRVVDEKEEKRTVSAVPGQFSIMIISDENAQAKAEEFAVRLAKQEPFKQLIEKNIVILKPEPYVVAGLKCKGGYLGIERLAECELDKVKKICQDIDLCPVYTSVPKIGAGGKKFPIVSSSFPWTTMLHEVVHQFGFTDEYAYTRNEVGTYCGRQYNLEWFNGRSMKAKNEYSSKAKAITDCLNAISWCKQARAAGAEVVQEIRKGVFAIGSPLPEKCPSLKLGVYAGGSCQNQNPDFTFRPYFCPNVMGFPTLGEETCEVTRRHAIIAASPNLLPPLYKKAIFDSIASSSGHQDAVYVENEKPDLAKHLYGIPEVDKLSGSDLEDKCQP